jgi:insulysin
MIVVKPIKELKEIIITFPLPDTNDQYKANPSRYISHLIGHEADGSILALLKKKGWALELSAGQSTGGKGFSFFKINIDLTDEGLGM